MEARPLRLVSAGVLAGVERAIRTLAEAWQGNWGLADVAIELTVERAWEQARSAGKDWRLQWSSPQGRAWCHWHAELAGEIQRLVFPADGGYAVAAEGMPQRAPALAAEALDGLLDALRGGVMGADVASELLRQPEPELLQPLSGAVAVSMRIGRQTVRLLLDTRAVSVLSPAIVLAEPAPLERVDMFGALANVPVSLSVIAGRAELGAGTLMSAGVGDVIRLQTALPDPFSLECGVGKPLAQAYPGRSGAHFAVEIAAMKK
jgi:flagellar motor switch/type III secretory pathway protein FliN